ATLESEGYAVTAASDGAQALKLFPQDKFDCVILDVMMPKMNGFDVCRELRERDKRVPVLFLTAKGEVIDKVVGLKLGADDYVTKPFGVQELLARVEALLRRARSAAQPTVAGGPDGPRAQAGRGLRRPSGRGALPRRPAKRRVGPELFRDNPDARPACGAIAQEGRSQPRACPRHRDGSRGGIPL